MHNYQPVSDKQYCRAHFGDMSQLCSVRRSFLMDGRARMVEALDFDNGSGLTFTALPGRGMDVAWAKYRGVPLCFMTKAGVASPDSYDPEGMGWLWNFFGGMFTTCGMSNVGNPCDDVHHELGNVHYGLHGRLTNTAACHVGSNASWEEGEYCLSATGQMREGVLHAQNLSLTRTLSTKMGKNCIEVEDVVENEGFVSQELMLLYHINIGHPVLSAGTRLLLPEGTQTITTTCGAPCDPIECGQFTEPYPEAPQHVFLHTFPKNDRGTVELAMYNPELQLGIALAYNPEQLPYFNQWKRMSAGDYVVGLEPANCMAIGRIEMRKKGIQMLEPGETRRFGFKLSIIDGEEGLAAFEARRKG